MSALIEILEPGAPAVRNDAPLNTTAQAALLVPVTDEARAAIAGATFIRMSSFPFNIGRESRALNAVSRVLVGVERRLSAAPPLNDLYLVEPGGPLVQVSRKHCAVDRVGSGFLLIDRNSACGSAVVHSAAAAGAFVERIGVGTPGDRAVLEAGDLIVFGNGDSPYVFRFEIDRRHDSQHS